LTFNSYKRENSLENKIRFQGQEHIGDLGLNWDSFKWRNHQPDIGRFFGVDPLAEKYYYNSPYAFSENKVVAHVELEGLESYYTMDKQGEGYDPGNRQETVEAIKTVGTFIAYIWHSASSWAENYVQSHQQKDSKAPIDGNNFTVTTKGPTGEYANNLPPPADGSNNTVVTDRELAFFFSIAKGDVPGARANSGPIPEGGQPTPIIPFAEAVKGTTEAVTGASGSVEKGTEEVKEFYHSLMPSPTGDSTIVTTTAPDGTVTKDTVNQKINEFDQSTLR
jgi:RHS repeat-associated protein